MSKLLSNLPIEDLNSDNDYLGIIDKGQIIKTFLESNTEEFKDIKMFSLHGEWGSGKSTLMKYLQKELKEDFNTFFFEAWEFESDSNLSLSLLEYLTKKTKGSTEEGFEEILNAANKLFKGFTKSLKVSFPLGIANISIDGNEFHNNKEEDSFLELKEKFKTEFNRWENNKTENKKHEFNIIFIDDLDRCEPENVLNLLSALKLFFTYGEKTIFFCGIDKKAVNEAVKTKYGKVVKANEYLEKIFDISFTMPEHDDILKLVSQYFDDRNIETIGGKLNESISFFFKELKFINPRRLKKVLNKYLMFKWSVQNNINSKDKYPNLYFEDSGNYFETILVLYFIILHEFFPLIFLKLFNSNPKENSIMRAINNSIDSNSIGQYKNSLFHYIEQKIELKKLLVHDFTIDNFSGLIFVFMPGSINFLDENGYSNYHFEKMTFKKECVEYLFLNYLLKNPKIMKHDYNSFSDISLEEIKKLVKKFL